MTTRGIIYRIMRPWYKFQVDHCPKKQLEKRWSQFFSEPIHWDNPQTLNEKIMWLICYSDTSVWTKLADKVGVREFVSNKGFADLLVPILGVWSDAKQIDFDTLPQKFVLKCNHDAGSVIIVDKNKGYDKDDLKRTLNSKLKRKYGYVGVEPHYNGIKPLILAEEFLEMDSRGISTSAIDYKVFCYNGVPDIILTVYNRHPGEYCNLEVWDVNWKHIKEYENDNSFFLYGNGIIPRPDNLQKMLNVAKSLSAGFPQVRVDFYEVHGKLYFGEMTFTTDNGTIPYFSDLYQQRAGEKIDLSLAKLRKSTFFQETIIPANYNRND